MKTPDSPNSLPTDTLAITITKFRPLGGVFPISATMSLPPGVTQDFPIQVDGTNITMGVHEGTRVQLVFHLLDPDHILLGVAFATDSSVAPAGQTTFPDIEVTRTISTQGIPIGSRMILTDSPQATTAQSFDYVILVQSVRTGEIGIIDPRIINDPEFPPP